MWIFVNKLASPKHGYHFLGRLQPWLGALSVLLFIIALFFALGVAPRDVQQGEVYRIIFLHVPAAVMSLSVYLVMATAALIYRVWKIKLADSLAKISAPLGVLFTLTTLVSGSLWGKPTWGTYWIWDARLTSEAILLFIYLGIIALRSAIPNEQAGAKASSLLIFVGLVNLPIIHYSVQWWHTLHQGPTLLKLATPNMPASMLMPLLLMLSAYAVFYGYLVCLRLRNEIVLRESESRWFQQSEMTR